ncbi:MAG: hypothetical protein WBX02_07855 [Terriglobales bacterium]
MTNADKIRLYGEEKYVLLARRQRLNRFSIRVGDIVRDLKLTGRAPAVCSALKTNEFLEKNDLRLIETTGPKSGQSTTVVYTYEFKNSDNSTPPAEDSWTRLRGALKDVFSDLGGGESYLRAERNNFYSEEEKQTKEEQD